MDIPKNDDKTPRIPWWSVHWGNMAWIALIAFCVFSAALIIASPDTEREKREDEAFAYGHFMTVCQRDGHKGYECTFMWKQGARL